jgi:hypothetical protein
VLCFLLQTSTVLLEIHLELLYLVIHEDELAAPSQRVASPIQNKGVRCSLHCSEWQAPLLCYFQYSEIVSISCFHDVFLCEFMYVTKHVIVSYYVLLV